MLSRDNSSDVNKARTLKAKAKHYQGQGHSPKTKAIQVGNEAGTVPSRTTMGDHGKYVRNVDLEI